jgi:hypothetical protein
MFRYIGSSVYVTGIVSAGQQTTGCVANTQYTNTCYHIVLYTAMTQIINNEYPGSSIVAG